MSKYEKLLFKVLRGTSDANISFNDLCGLVKRFGFEERTRGSHHVFRKEGIEEKINLQRENDKAKPYQVSVDSLIDGNAAITNDGMIR